MPWIREASPTSFVPPRNRRGFTLVELLVVMGIIAILISILLPVIGRARRQSKNVQCLTNLRSLQEAFMGYVNTNQHSFFYLDPATRGGQLFTWEGNLKPMYSNENVRLCPEAGEASQRPDGYGTATTAYGFRTNASDPNSVLAVTTPAPGAPSSTNRSFGSYGFNGFLYRIDSNQRDYTGAQAKVAIWGGAGNTSINPSANYAKYWFGDPLTLDGGDIPASVPAATGVTMPPGFGASGSVPVFADCNYLNAWPESTGSSAAQHDPTPTAGGYVIGTGDIVPTPAASSSNDHNLGRFCLDRHPGGINVVFLDGHARTVSLPELWLLRWNKSFVPITVNVP